MDMFRPGGDKKEEYSSDVKFEDLKDQTPEEMDQALDNEIKNTENPT